MKNKIFDIQTGQLILDRRLDRGLNNKKKKSLGNFLFPENHWWKINESEKIDKYFDLARELKASGIWERLWYKLLLVRWERSLKRLEPLEISG